MPLVPGPAQPFDALGNHVENRGAVCAYRVPFRHLSSSLQVSFEPAPLAYARERPVVSDLIERTWPEGGRRGMARSRRR